MNCFMSKASLFAYNRALLSKEIMDYKILGRIIDNFLITKRKYDRTSDFLRANT